MPRVKNRERVCKHCEKKYLLENGLHKYCCIQCRLDYQVAHSAKKYRRGEKGKQVQRVWRLKTIYGITIEEYDAIFLSQNSRCAICYIETPMGYGWHLDHCHLTNKVRGILCSKCNQGMGLLQDNAEILKRAGEYIEKHRDSS